MAEAVAAFYAIETAVEAAAISALAVSGATVPLHAKFQKVNGAPSTAAAVKGSTTHVVKNKLYIVGGEAAEPIDDHGIHVLSFAPDFGSSRTTLSQPLDLDYELQKPEFAIEQRPLQAHSKHLEEDVSVAKDLSHRHSWARNKHASAAVDDKIYVLGGVFAGSNKLRKSNTEHIIPLDTILAFDTLRSTYSAIAANTSKSTEGIPEPRYSASCTSSPNPSSVPALQGEGPTIEAHGTIFLHGGYDVSGQPLHDTWTFDIGTRAWHKFPTIVEEALHDRSSPGQISYVDGRLWYVNSSTVMYLDLSERQPLSDDDVPPVSESLSTGRVGSGQWQVVYPTPEADPAVPAEKYKTKSATAAKADSIPTEPTNHVAPVTTGAGRLYLVTCSSTNPQQMHLFQIPSSAQTAASVKDTIRDKTSSAISALSDDWKSGKHEWSKIEVLRSTKEEGELKIPSTDLEDFSVATWEEYGNKLVFWGGKTEIDDYKNEGWVLQLD
ncbi:hypothetical protein LTS08_001525 [Lithohypha guttulata]|uniref:uncharacterized protein n=1 Tax=Lithohypha guttulata TaxID=1690604 RepID=UPI002DDF9410|nr:hypothetical protein LTR51_003809 [Lithohypha guttulata]KAK5105250.1 hypothetical protein LTS08_001525 [Lithohypha guttulata]